MDKWDRRFLNLAKHISEWSKDPSTKVGAVIVDNNHRIISVGYNGIPQGVDDLRERLDNRDIKWNVVIHAETNAILFSKRDLEACTIYTYPLLSCPNCTSIIIQSGIKRIVSLFSNHPRLEENLKLSRQLYYEAGVVIQLYYEEELDELKE